MRRVFERLSRWDSSFADQPKYQVGDMVCLLKQSNLNDQKTYFVIKQYGVRYRKGVVSWFYEGVLCTGHNDVFQELQVGRKVRLGEEEVSDNLVLYTRHYTVE